MKREEFRRLITSRMVFMDGATGSILLKRGMPSGVCVEDWIRKNPGLICQLQKEYRQAGSDIILAPTFGANRPLLTEHGLGGEVKDLNKALVKIAKEANPDALIAGDVSMTGLSLEPMGDTAFEELIDIYKEQIEALCEAGVDLIDIETIINLADARAAVIAAKEVCDLPLIVTMSFNENGMTLYGTAPEAAVISLQALGVDAFGINCSAGPDNVLPIVEKMHKFAGVPLIVKPNAGKPSTDEKGNTVYSMPASEFVGYFEDILKLGVHVIGGCCGTGPEYIKGLHERYAGHEVSGDIYHRTFEDGLVATSRIGLPAKEVEDFEIFDCDAHELSDIPDEINDLLSDFICLKGKDARKLECAARVYNGVPMYDSEGEEPGKDIKFVMKKYGIMAK